MNCFDRFIDSFSMKDLAKRVNAVIVFGIAIILIASIGGYFFLTDNFTVSVEGVVTENGAHVDDEGNVVIQISIDHADIDRLPTNGKLKIDANATQPKLKFQNILIKSIDPTTGVIEIAFTDERLSAPIKKGEEVRLIIADAPFWKLLFKK